MSTAQMPKWLPLSLLLAAIVIIVLASVAWAAEYRVQSAGLFAFGILFGVQAVLLFSKAKPQPKKG